MMLKQRNGGVQLEDLKYPIHALLNFEGTLPPSINTMLNLEGTDQSHGESVLTWHARVVLIADR